MPQESLHYPCLYTVFVNQVEVPCPHEHWFINPMKGEVEIERERERERDREREREREKERKKEKRNC